VSERERERDRVGGRAKEIEGVGERKEERQAGEGKGGSFRFHCQPGGLANVNSPQKLSTSD
jgi:hypothetical protein